jgi:actin related protein 2/3 complex subunit 2
MILLETGSRILEEVIRQRVQSDKREAVDITLADFDGTQYHIATNATQRNLVTVSISWPCISQMKQFGTDAKVQSFYGPLVTSTENGYDYTLQFDLDNLGADKDALPGKIALFKRTVVAAPLEAVFDGKPGLPPVITINYRTNEAVYLKREGNNVAVIFSINFKDKDDIVIGKVFLQELEAARKTINNAPAITFSQKERPLELKSVQNVYEGEDQGFVTFLLFGPHTHETRRGKTIDTIHLFRNYLHYHIKCSKAFLHTRMRLRVEELLQVLNRAKIKNANKDMKTMSGRTFKRA